jgi:CHAD domain-containing protein
MPFRFKKSESPAKAVRRACRERVGAALNCLRKAEHPAAVHGARKEIKKLRALFRLVRGEISVGTYRKGVKALRAAADCLAAARDARVMLKAFEQLVGPSARKFAGIESALKKHARREARQFRRNDSVALAERLLRKSHRRVAELKIKASGWAAIEPGLKQSYARGRAAWQLARKKTAPEHFHAWRKRVKDLWYYFCLLQPASRAASRTMTDELEILSEQLGEDHDLFLLQQFITEHCSAHAEELAALARLIQSRQKKLRAAALKLGARLYDEIPAKFCRRLLDYTGNQ